VLGILAQLNSASKQLQCYASDC